MVITPTKEAQWIMGSFEETADSDLSAQVPALISDAFNRLEEAAFVTATGSGQPFGAITRATVDGNTGLVNAASAGAVFSLSRWAGCGVLPPAMAEREKGPGHRVVYCHAAPGCQSAWYQPRHDPDYPAGG